MLAQKQKRITENRLLAALSDEDYKSLLLHLKPVHLTAGQVLYEPTVPFIYCYFPNNVLVSLVSITEQGACVAVGMVGSEGLLGAATLLGEDLLPYRVISMCSGRAMRMHTETLKDWIQEHPSLKRSIMNYATALFAQVVQTSACNRFHNIEHRIARWLLLAQDRLDLPTLPFTHDSLSKMLGTDRVSITRAVKKMKKAGLIDYKRGKITILHREALESAICECYSVIKSEYNEPLK